MKKFFVLALFFGLCLTLPAQYVWKRPKFDPGFSIIPSKSYYATSVAPDFFSVAAGPHVSYHWDEWDAIQVGLLFASASGPTRSETCIDSVPPCIPRDTRVSYLKFPVFYRFTPTFLGTSLMIKTLIGPQFTMFLGPQEDVADVYAPFIVEAAAGFEVMHPITNQVFLSLGARADYAITNPENPDATFANGELFFPADRKRPNQLNIGLVLSVDILLDRSKE